MEALCQVFKAFSQGARMDRLRFRDILHNSFCMTEDLIMDRGVCVCMCVCVCVCEPQPRRRGPVRQGFSLCVGSVHPNNSLRTHSDKTPLCYGRGKLRPPSIDIVL